MSVSPRFTCGGSNPLVMELGAGALGRSLAHEGGTLIDGISALIKALWLLPQ